MLGWLVRLKKSYKAAALWSKALDCAAQEDYVGAMAHLKAVYEVFGSRMPSESVTCDVNVLCANVACKLGDYSLSVSAITTALGQLKHSEAGISNADSEYLSIYCRDLLKYCAYKIRDEKVAELAASIKSEFDPELLPTVRQDIVRNFPIADFQSVRRAD